MTTVRQRHRRGTRPARPIKRHMLEDARNDAGSGYHCNHSQLTTTMRAALQVDGEHPLESGHPAERRNYNMGRAFVVRGDFH